MPSPFPGMDPYLEDPAIWPGFHHLLASEICADLNRGLPSPYYANMELRPELGILADDDLGPETGDRPRKRIIPDVVVLKHHAGGVAVAEPPRQAVSRSVEFGNLPEEPARHFFVEIIDPTKGHRLVTLIEILSPTNKRAGVDRQAYAAKQRAILESDTNLVEIDLLRTGHRVLPTPELEEAIARLVPPPEYLVLVSRSWKRYANSPMWGYCGYPAYLREPLPCVGIPLAQDQPEPPLDLQTVLRRAYDGGPYRRGAVDYTRPPSPPLPEPDAPWAAGLVREALEPR